ncbi:MAG: histidinol-phosphatase [Paracoccaceae bacterium]|nr:histidinol-phosphatase [Paracoccaceae bacterium]
MTIQLAEAKNVAFQLADVARAAILPHFRKARLEIENKEADGFDPVTIADRAAETAMRRVLADLRPDDGILGEEEGTSIGTSGLTWILDPIDGTRGFMSGTPTWGVLIALSDENGPIFGVIDQPFIGERFWGGMGENGQSGPMGEGALGVRKSSLRDAVIFTTFPEVGSPTEARGFHDVAKECKLTRYGMDCYAYALLAAGQIDLVVEASLQPYDIAAPIAVIQAAGGMVTNWQGGPAHDGGRVIAAGCAEVHAAALEILKDIPND